MRGFSRALFALVALTVLPAAPAAAGTIADGKAFITAYIVLSNNYRASLGDLYADDAALRLTARLPDGTSREVSLSGAQYKAMLPRVIPLARRRGEQVQFSDIRYTSEGEDRLRITALRHALADGYSVPHVMVIVRDGLGRWVIVEEAGEARVEPPASPGDAAPDGAVPASAETMAPADPKP
jgi:hypothetical protein